MDFTDLAKAATELSVTGILAVIVVLVAWLAYKDIGARREASKVMARQHSADIDRVCEVFSEQMRYEREQCAAQVRSVIEKFENAHRENLQAIQLVARR